MKIFGAMILGLRREIEVPFQIEQKRTMGEFLWRVKAVDYKWEGMWHLSSIIRRKNVIAHVT